MQGWLIPYHKKRGLLPGTLPVAVDGEGARTLRSGGCAFCKFCQKAVQGGTGDPQQAGHLLFADLPGMIAGIDGFKTLGIQSDGSAALVSAVCLGDGNALPLPFQNVLPLELVDGTDHRQHQLSGGGGGIDVLLVADQMNLLALEQLHDSKQVRSASGQAAEIVDVDGISLPGKFQHGLQLGAVGVLAGDLLSKPALDIMLGQGIDLTLLILFGGGYTDIVYVRESGFENLSWSIAALWEMKSL